MSLESNGSSFDFFVQLSETQKEVLTGHPAKELSQTENLSDFSFTSEVKGNSEERKRIAFMRAMWEFTNSPQFSALTYDLEDHFQIKVRHTINLSMPKL